MLREDKAAEEILVYIGMVLDTEKPPTITANDWIRYGLSFDNELGLNTPCVQFYMHNIHPLYATQLSVIEFTKKVAEQLQSVCDEYEKYSITIVNNSVIQVDFARLGSQNSNHKDWMMGIFGTVGCEVKQQ